MACLLCRSERTIQFLDLGKQPLANKYPREDEFETESFVPLTVNFCEDCKNVALDSIVSRAKMFEDYFYLSSVNPGLVRHFEQLADTLRGSKFVLDIGSNDGILLKPLKARGISTLGVDPSINVSKIANDLGLETLTGFFDAEMVRRVLDTYSRPDVIVASSIFTHLEDPHTFVDDVQALLSDEGTFIVEVEYIGDIIKETQFERFYLDRIFYYSLTALSRLFEQHGMYVHDVKRITPHGGSLQVFVKNRVDGVTSSPAVNQLLTEEVERLTPHTLHSFAARVDEYIGAFRSKLEEYHQRGLQVAGYGAPARVSTICNYGHIGPDLISFIVDDSPLKQGRFTPGTHIPIVERTQLSKKKQDILVVFAYEYFDDIKERTKEGKYRYLIAIPPQEVT